MPGGSGKEKGIERSRVQEECPVAVDGRAFILYCQSRIEFENASMRGRLFLIFPLLLALAACSLVPGAEPTATGEDGVTAAPYTPPATDAASPAPTLTSVPAETTATPMATATAATTATPPATETATAVPAPSNTPPATAEANGDLALTADDVFVYPGPDVYSGDDVTFYVLAQVPDAITPSDVEIELQVEEQLTLTSTLNDRNLAGEAVGLFAWAWETEGLTGNYEVTVTLDPDDAITIGDENPDNNQVTFSVPVRPSRFRPPREIGAVWVTDATDCCILHVISGTAAHRDLGQLRETANAAVEEAAGRLGVEPQKKINIYLIDRVIGQGGYAGSNIVVSYVDRNYAGGGLYEVLLHEAVHVLDRQFAPNRIAFMAEGLAVWATGGHYKQVNIDERMAALHRVGRELPLPDLIEAFYLQQHEISYLQAAGFISYLVNTYGWERVKPFYSAVSPRDGMTLVQVMDQALQEHFGASLDQVKAGWMAYLDGIPHNPEVEDDLLTTIRYYDIMRRYQLHYAPTAHFLKAWLPFPQELEERGLTAELTRRPAAELNVTLEVMLGAVDRALMAGERGRANVILDSVERVLDNGGQFVDPLSVHYQDLVTKLMDLGFEVHQVEMEGNRAVVQVTEGRRVTLRTVTMVLRNRAWIFLH